MKNHVLPCLLLLLFSLVSLPAGLLAAQEAPIFALAAHENLVVTSPAPLKRVMVDNPEIATVTILNSRELLINANQVGQTTIRLWKQGGQEERIPLTVAVDADVQQRVRDLVTALDPEGKVSANLTATDRVVLSGSVPTASRGERLANGLASLGFQVTNLLAVQGGQQVQLFVRVAEVVKGNPLSVGVGVRDKRDRYGLFPPGNLGPAASFLLNVDEIASGTVRSLNFPYPDAFQIGVNPRGADFYGVLSLLEGHSLARVLAQPTLVVESGKTADFHAGGEVPIPVAQEDNKVTVEWKKFGVKLNFSPVILEDGIIDLHLTQEVSNIEWTNGIQVGSISLPGFRTRNTDTFIKLRDGESFVISGLLHDETRSIVNKVPVLGDIPVLGALFRSSSYQQDQSELAVVVTPRLVRPIAAGQPLHLPGANLSRPSTFDAILLGKLVDHTPSPAGQALLGEAGLETP